VEGGSRRGLGRGLESILPGARPAASAPPAPDLERADSLADHLDDLIEAGLDALEHALGHLDVCAYLHWADGAGPELHLRALVAAPDGSFRVSRAMTELLEDGPWARDERAARLAGVPVLVIRTSGSRSYGLHAVGRRTGVFTPAEQVTAINLCRALGGACHTLEAPSADASRSRLPHPTRVTVQLSEGVAHAEITYLTSRGLDTAHARAASPALAVAEAMVAASGEDVRVADVAEVPLDGRAAVVVLLDQGHGRATAVGSAPASPDPQRAAALATLAAIERLQGS